MLTLRAQRSASLLPPTLGPLGYWQRRDSLIAKLGSVAQTT
ncbi:hypothetical protein ACT3UD_04105 [Glutamicibacter sp. 287]|nr:MULTISPECIES: hypothetical protein [Micrococcaceae]